MAQYDADPQPRYSLFASGLARTARHHCRSRGGYLRRATRGHAHLRDTDGDGRADDFKTIWKIPIWGNYHEYAFGPVYGPQRKPAGHAERFVRSAHAKFGAVARMDGGSDA